MRNHFDEQLSQLHSNLLEMGALIERAIARAMNALENRDAAEAREVIEGDAAIDDKEREIESQCLKLLLFQQPVARDLVEISTALKMITDMERIGDNASDISELCLNLAGQDRYTRIAMPEHIPQMAAATAKMVTGSIDAFVKKDLDLARAVIVRDDAVNKLFTTVKKDLIAMVHENADNGEGAFDLLQIAKYYERIGDHAVNIAGWVIFSITGKRKNRQIL
jgi:phosphate transport system protein